MRPFLPLLALLPLAACAGPVRYAPAPQVPLTAASLDVARAAERMVEARLGQAGDFHAGDLVRLSFPYMPQLTADQRVQLSGAISPPLLPPVAVTGLTAAALQARLTQLYRAKLDRPEVSVAILEYNRPPPPPEIFVLGEVIKPGSWPYRDGTTPFEALARAGGGNRDADLTRIVALTPRGDVLEARMLDLAATLSGSRAPLAHLSPYTVLIVPPKALARDVDRARQIRQVIGFNGFNIGSGINLVNN